MTVFRAAGNLIPSYLLVMKQDGLSSNVQEVKGSSRTVTCFLFLVQHSCVFSQDSPEVSDHLKEYLFLTLVENTHH